MDDLPSKPNSPPRVYVTPASHDDDIRKMITALAGFFSLLMVLVITIVIYASDLAKLLPFSVEQRFVKPYEAMADYWFDEEPTAEHQDIQRSLQELSDELALSMALPSEFELQVHYVDTDQVNAIATLGGHMFVFRGLLEVMPDENSLAMVLAHEIAHIKHRDAMAGLGRGLALQMFYSFISGDYSAGVDIALQTGEIGILYFSREQERQADAAAIQALQAHYGHVYGYDQLFQYLHEHQNDDTDSHADNSGDGNLSTKTLELTDMEWFSSHPELQERIETLTALAKSHQWLLEGNAAPLRGALAGFTETNELEGAPKFRRLN
ncbi:MAG: M48 family metallopeptidase [Cellvibrionaceae bacterium]